MPSSALPDSNQRLTVGLKPLGKASRPKDAIESVVPSGFRPTRPQYDWKLRRLRAVLNKKIEFHFLTKYPDS